MGDPVLADEIGGRWDHVLVDEYQDTNRLQSSILMALKLGGRGLTVVGDDAQAIYSFRAATVRNILDFPNEFSPKADVITLDRNYRSTQPILAAANGVIGLAQERYTKNLWTDRASNEKPRLVTVRDEGDQARFVADEVLDNREGGMRLKDQAVLFRASHHSGPLEVELNLLHRLTDGKPVTPPVIRAPQALSLSQEPKANVERYDALRKLKEARHAS